MDCPMFTGYTDGDSTTERVGSGGSGIFFLSFFVCEVQNTDSRLNNIETPHCVFFRKHH